MSNNPQHNTPHGYPDDAVWPGLFDHEPWMSNPGSQLVSRYHRRDSIIDLEGAESTLIPHTPAVIYPTHASTVTPRLHLRQPSDQEKDAPQTIQGVITLKVIYLMFHSHFKLALCTIMSSLDLDEQQEWVQGLLGILLHDVPKLLPSERLRADSSTFLWRVAGAQYNSSRVQYLDQNGDNALNFSIALSETLGIACDLLGIPGSRNGADLWLKGWDVRQRCLTSSPANILLAQPSEQNQRSEVSAKMLKAKSPADILLGQSSSQRVRSGRYANIFKTAGTAGSGWSMDYGTICSLCPQEQPEKVFKDCASLRLVLFPPHY